MIDLLQGDCLELMKDIPNGSIDMILCDLPYGTTACKWDIVIPFEPMWEELNRILKDNGIIVLFGSQPFTTMLIYSNINNFLYEWVWEKNNCSNFQLANIQPLRFHENILVFKSPKYDYIFSKIIKNEMETKNISYDAVSSLVLSKTGKKTGWLFNKISGLQHPTEKQWEKICELFGIKSEYQNLKHCYNTNTTPTHKVHSNKNKGGSLGHISTSANYYIQKQENYPRTVLRFDREKKPIHPTQKPIALLEYLIKTYTNEGETVLDFTMGSGSTGVACVNTNRKFIGIELDENYYNIAKERIEKAKNQQMIV